MVTEKDSTLIQQNEIILSATYNGGTICGVRDVFFPFKAGSII